MERFSLRAYQAWGRGLALGLGVGQLGVGLASAGQLLGRAANMIHTGLPRHSTVNFSPGLMAEISTSTAAPAALARSEG
jgi:hypothetical protein